MASTSTSGRGEQKHDPFVVLESPKKNIKSSLTAKQYDVFINHRGPDAKTTVAERLYDCLQEAGIRAYLDAPETELGDYFPSAIKNAIYSATVHTAILSPRYAESAWCLAELALMFQTRARIIPLFYHVSIADFRHIKNEVENAFSKHEKKKNSDGKDRYPKHVIEQWKVCLQNVSGIKGYELNGQNENDGSLWNSILEYIRNLLSDCRGIRLSSTGSDLSKVCNDVVCAVVKEKQKRKIPFRVAKYPVGLDELVKDFHSHCQVNGEMKDKIIGIYGMGGSGKTTLVKDLSNRKHSEFSKSTILFDVRENDVKGALTSLQSKLLKDLFSENHEPFSSTEEGIAVIEDNLQKSPESRFLIVIDDADHQKQLDALLSIDALNPNSLVIVTTRDERLLIKAGVKVRYKIRKMNREHSKELFCWYAFHRKSCKSGFENLVDSFVETCAGLPLALGVMGGHVFGSDKAYWELQVGVVKESLHKDIEDTLKISYDSLEEDQKEIFMDIACFFIGEDVSRAISIWKASGWRAEHALETLKDKCLVEVQTDFYGKHDYLGAHYDKSCHYKSKSFFRMHDHLRDLGRKMADNEMSHPRRLWRPKDLSQITKIKEFQDTLSGSEGISVRCSSVLNNFECGLQMTYFLGSSKTTDLQWLKLKSHYRYSGSIPEWIPLQNLQTLRLKNVSPARLWQRDDQVLLKLKELSCNFNDLIQDFNGLVSSFGMLKHLESLHLNYQSDTNTPAIEWNCFLKSVRELTNLQTLELTSFKVEGEFALSNRGETSDDQFRMRSLESITLCFVSKVTVVSISGQFCPNLKSLKLCSMSYLIEVDLTGVTTLECLMLKKCGELKKVLGNDLLQLEIFRISLCKTIRKLPNFGCLKRIYISSCEKLQDVSAIKRLKGLERIWIAYCPELKNIKVIEQLKGLKRIWIQECNQLEGVICFKELKELKRIFIGYCGRLQSIEVTELLIRLENIIIAGCPRLQNIRGIEELEGLKKMIISDSPCVVSCVEKSQRLASELTILVERLVMKDKDDFTWRSYFGDALSMADGFCEMNCKYAGELRKPEVLEMIRSFQTQHSPSTFIFCAVLLGGTLEIKSDIYNRTKIAHDILYDNDYASLSAEWKIYTCVFTEEMLSKYDFCLRKTIESFFRGELCLMAVKEGDERKTLQILQSLFSQPCVEHSEYSVYPEDPDIYGLFYYVEGYDDLAAYFDVDGDSDGDGDGDGDGDNVSEL